MQPVQFPDICHRLTHAIRNCYNKGSCFIHNVHHEQDNAESISVRQSIAYVAE
jgi:hypothetical protein